MSDPSLALAASPSAPTHSGLTPSEARLIVFGVMLAMFLAALDQTIVSTALPTIGRELGDPAQLTWVVTAYLLAATVVTPLYGKLSDIYGRRITLLTAIGVFLTGSAACALSPTMLILIIARTFQGLGGGGLIALSMTIIGDIIPPKQRPRFQAYVSGVFVLASLAGPLLGGFIAEHLHWSIIFWINPPIGLLTLGAIYRLLGRLPVHRQHRYVDFAGAALFVVATVALLLTLSWGGRDYAWNSPPIMGLLGVFAVFTALFLVRQQRAREPLLPLSVMANQVVLTGTTSCMFAMGTYIGLIIVMPIYFELVRHLSPTQSGMALVPLMVGVGIGAGIGGRLMVNVTHYKRLPLIGLAIAAAAMVVVALDPVGLPFAVVEVLVAMTSIGFGPILPVTTICVQNAAPAGQLGTATAMVTFARQLGGVIMVAIFGAILFSGLHASGHLQSLAEIGRIETDAQVANIFRWIFAAVALGLLVGLVAFAAMRELPLKDKVADEEAVMG